MDHRSLRPASRATRQSTVAQRSSASSATTAAATQKKRSGSGGIQEPAAKQSRVATRASKANADSLLSSSESPQQQQQQRSSNSTVAITPLSAARGNHQNHPGGQTSSPRRLDNDGGAQRLPSNIHLPPHVPNLFSFPALVGGVCQCCPAASVPSRIPCAGRCISADFLHSYGWEYKTLLRETEALEYKCYPSSGGKDDDATDDPLQTLVSSGIVPALDKRARQQTDWFGPQSMNWDLDDYMDRQPDLNSRMRTILVDWIVELSEEYKLSASTFHLAITLVDKSLACTPSEQSDTLARGGGLKTGFLVARDMLQCLGCACTWIAAKMEEVVPPTIDDFVYISDNTSTAEQIKQMELDVCMHLKFRLQHVTPVQYAHEYLLAASEQNSCNSSSGPSFHPILHNLVDYLLELSRFPYEFVNIKPSLIASAVLFLARATLGMRDGFGYWTKTLQYYTGYRVEQLKDTVRILLAYQQEAESSVLKAVFKKYNKAKFFYVSAKTVLSKDDLDLECFMSHEESD